MNETYVFASTADFIKSLTPPKASHDGITYHGENPLAPSGNKQSEDPKPKEKITYPKSMTTPINPFDAKLEPSPKPPTLDKLFVPYARTLSGGAVERNAAGDPVGNVRVQPAKHSPCLNRLCGGDEAVPKKLHKALRDLHVRIRDLDQEAAKHAYAVAEARHDALNHAFIQEPTKENWVKLEALGPKDAYLKSEAAKQATLSAASHKLKDEVTWPLCRPILVDHILPKLKEKLLAYETAEKQAAEEIGCPWEPSAHLHSLAYKIFTLEDMCKREKFYGTPKDLLGEFSPEIFSTCS